MSEDRTTRLSLPYLAGGQLQKHVTLNDALTRLDALIHLAVVSRTVGVQPPDPVQAQSWILPSDAAGPDWSAMAEGQVATWRDGGWSAVDAPPGALAAVEDEEQFVVRAATGWRPLGESLGRIDHVDRLGVGTSPDATNPFAARLNGALMAALETADGGTGDVRLTISKADPDNVGSLLLQTAFQARAEFGLIGSDAVGLKVSADGVSWSDAFAVDPATGRVTFAKGAQRRESVVFTASGAYAPPAWARSVEALVVGAGGGGAGGQGGPAGTLRMGGGGGGAGGLAEAAWPTESLTGAITVSLGSGGAGGAPGGAGGEGAHSAINMDGVIILRAFGGGGGAPSGAAGAGGLARRSGNDGGPSYPAVTASVGLAAVCPEGPGGGGGGGAVTAMDAALAGGAGGAGGVMAASALGGAAGAGAAGGAGGAAPLPALCRSGGGGGGGGGASSGPGFAGAAAGQWGAGGGGGGAGLATGGAGGAGAAGLVILTAVG